ncbi:hypothetical protein B0A52_04545 [Exophiala mesophila]|uniref:D-isomer specific 2-hydroxyacid dehydrogenase NAD-binding domain-containing protein n=1 Tax=Exophiala mesophila TaxID=212818 RepID=A0A438N994_EXOME|nr:hypothetical protein B0A52_04545 [Exophiala mesophila]
MVSKTDILMIDSTVQVIDVERRAALAEKFNLIYYDCENTTEFIQRLQPGGPYSKIVAILRNGWLKAGPLAQQTPFASEIVPHYPPSLKLICCSGHGHDAADVEAIKARGIWYCNTPDTCTEAVANTTLSLVLECFRFFTYAQWCARNDWLSSRDLGLKAVDPCGKALGIVGMGDIGLAIAEKCESALGMKIHYHGRRRKLDAEHLLKYGASYHDNLDEMISVVDCVVIAAPYSKDTHHLLSRERLSLAKKDGLRVVNIARGKMIDEDALIEALEDGRVVGAGLDVHANEPGINPKLRDNWRVTLLPHIGVCSRTSWENFERVNLDNVEAFFTTGKPLTPVT